jgi:hypothetical protein
MPHRACHQSRHPRSGWVDSQKSSELDFLLRVERWKKPPGRFNNLA